MKELRWGQKINAKQKEKKKKKEKRGSQTKITLQSKGRLTFTVSNNNPGLVTTMGCIHAVCTHATVCPNNNNL